jgi:hypothetical protein
MANLHEKKYSSTFIQVDAEIINLSLAVGVGS